MRTYVIPTSIKRELEREAERMSTDGLEFLVCNRVIQVYYLGHFVVNINFTKDWQGIPDFRLPQSRGLREFQRKCSYSSTRSPHDIVYSMVELVNRVLYYRW